MVGNVITVAHFSTSPGFAAMTPFSSIIITFPDIAEMCVAPEAKVWEQTVKASAPTNSDVSDSHC